MDPYLALAIAAAHAAAAWLAILLHPARPTDCRPWDDEDPEPLVPAGLRVVAIVPAHDEAALLPRTLPALLAQETAAAFSVVVVDDRSQDATAEVAARHGARVEVVRGSALPAGWAGKVWALEQGWQRLGDTPPDYVLLTDADILHARDSLDCLLADCETRGLALTSRMAKLRCDSAWDALLIPAFVWFFNLLYPMRRVNDPLRRTAAAAGGCVLVKTEELTRLGGFGRMREAVIDDIALARLVKAPQRPIRLAWSRTRVRSERVYGRLMPTWRMVRRTAATELRASLLRLAGCLAGLLLLFVVPPLALAYGVLGAAPLPASLGALAWLLSAAAYRAAPRFYGCGPLQAFSLPLAGLLYGAMTVDSFARHRR